MILNREIKDFLLQVVSLQNNVNLYITDLDNVLIRVENKTLYSLSKPLSKCILRKLICFDLNNMDDNVSSLNKDFIVPIFEDYDLNKSCYLEIIAPIVIDDKIYGSLILTSNDKNNYYSELQFVESTLFFLKKLILQELNENFKINNTGEV